MAVTLVTEAPWHAGFAEAGGEGVACGSRRVVAARNGQAGTRKYSLHLIARGPAEAEASGQPGAGAARPACAPRISFSWLGLASLSLTALTQVWGLRTMPRRRGRRAAGVDGGGGAGADCGRCTRPWVDGVVRGVVTAAEARRGLWLGLGLVVLGPRARPSSSESSDVE